MGQLLAVTDTVSHLRNQMRSHIRYYSTKIIVVLTSESITSKLAN